MQSQDHDLFQKCILSLHYFKYYFQVEHKRSKNGPFLESILHLFVRPFHICSVDLQAIVCFYQNFHTQCQLCYVSFLCCGRTFLGTESWTILIPDGITGSKQLQLLDCFLLRNKMGHVWLIKIAMDLPCYVFLDMYPIL